MVHLNSPCMQILWGTNIRLKSTRGVESCTRARWKVMNGMRERESERHMLSPIHFLSISNGTRIWSFSFSEESLSGSYITFFQLRLWYIYFFIVLFYSQFFSFLFCELQIVNHFLTGFSVPKLTRFCYMNIKLKIDNVLLTYTIMNLC